jgi:hypothetical protein
VADDDTSKSTAALEAGDLESGGLEPSDCEQGTPAADGLDSEPPETGPPPVQRPRVSLSDAAGQAASSIESLIDDHEEEVSENGRTVKRRGVFLLPNLFTTGPCSADFMPWSPRCVAITRPLL